MDWTGNRTGPEPDRNRTGPKPDRTGTGPEPDWTGTGPEPEPDRYRIVQSTVQSIVFHGIHGIPWIPWNSMDSMEFHGFHGIPGAAPGASVINDIIYYKKYIDHKTTFFSTK